MVRLSGRADEAARHGRQGGRQPCLIRSDVAERHGLSADLHIDETLDPSARWFDYLVERTKQRGMGGKVVGSHVSSDRRWPNVRVSARISTSTRRWILARDGSIIWSSGRSSAAWAARWSAAMSH